MREDEKTALHALAGFCLPSKKMTAVLSFFGSAKEAVEGSEGDWEFFYHAAAVLDFSSEEKKRILLSRQSDFTKEYEKLKENGIRFLVKEEDEYPAILKECADAPRYLYVKGDTQSFSLPGAAIVGARKCTPYGAELARALAEKLSTEGIGIISGMAYGVDRAAHQGALMANGKTIAVLGCGVNRCYPSENQDIYEEILLKNGAIVSEYPPDTPPLSAFFPQRNRIIAGLSEGIILTEARKKSGSLITATLGLEYGRNIYAVPGRVTDVLSEGCNYLIREGAKPVLKSMDVLEDFTVYQEKKTKRKNGNNCVKNKKIQNPLESNSKIVYASLRLNLKHTEELQKETGLSPEILAGVLEQLIEEGRAKRYGQAYYALSGEGCGIFSER